MGDRPGIAKPLGRVLSSLGTRLKALRNQRGWTLERLSKLSKLSEPYLSRLESGSRQPSLAALLTLAQVYEIPLRTLLEGDTLRPCRPAELFVRELRHQESPTALPIARCPAAAPDRPAGDGDADSRQSAHDKFYRHEGEEWLYVISGGLNLIFEDERHSLQPAMPRISTRARPIASRRPESAMRSCCW